MEFARPDGGLQDNPITRHRWSAILRTNLASHRILQHDSDSQNSRSPSQCSLPSAAFQCSLPSAAFPVQPSQCSLPSAAFPVQPSQCSLLNSTGTNWRKASALKISAVSQGSGGRNPTASSAVTHLCSECSSLRARSDASATEQPRLPQPSRSPALEPGQRLAVGALGAWREALDPAAGEVEGDQLREGGGSGHGDMHARGRAGVKSRGRLATRRGAS